MRKGWQPSDPPTLLDRVWKGTRGDPGLTARVTAALGWLLDECQRRAEGEAEETRERQAEHERERNPLGEL